MLHAVCCHAVALVDPFFFMALARARALSNTVLQTGVKINTKAQVCRIPAILEFALCVATFIVAAEKQQNLPKDECVDFSREAARREQCL